MNLICVILNRLIIEPTAAINCNTPQIRSIFLAKKRQKNPHSNKGHIIIHIGEEPNEGIE